MPEDRGTVLISTHDLKVAGPLREAFRESGYEVDLVTPSEDLSGLDNPVLFILTGGLKNESAAHQARQAREHRQIPVFGIAREGEEGVRQAARALDLQEVFLHPPDPREVLLLGRTLIERNRLQEITGIVGETDAIREALERVVQFAPVQATVLLTGESGTGKELMARGIHALSPRRHKSFIAVNVAALSETLLESELFGHEKGAFTGAIDSRRGLFELAQGGTIFLDEIGEMPLHTQTKLLRVLEEREFYRVGGEKPIRVDVRVIAATNQGLRRLVEVGEFRRDLYFRLNVLNIELPPLRDRRDDIKPLVEGFVEEASKRHDRRFAGISPEAMRILKDYDWPGNVRELKNLVESMVVLAHGRRIEDRDIPEEVRNPRRKALLPAPIEYGAPPNRASGDGSLRPELEFVFRTLMNLRMDVDDLRRDFDTYRRDMDISEAEEVPLLHPSRPSIPPALEEVFPLQRQFAHEGSEAGEGSGAGEGSEAGKVGPWGDARWDDSRDERKSEWNMGSNADSSPPAGEDPGEGAASGLEHVVVYRPGMTMDDIEEQAIRAALSEVDGNRRKAAERLGIGERTLYRKIKKFGLEE